MLARPSVAVARRPLLFALGNKARSGKDTTADIIISCLPNTVKVSIAQPVYDVAGLIQEYFGISRAKHPELLQEIGMSMRRVYGEDVWIDIALKRIGAYAQRGINVVVSDMRFRNEAAKLVSAGFKTIRVVRNNRTIDRDPTHISEVDLDDFNYDHVIINDGTLEELRESVVDILRRVKY